MTVPYTLRELVLYFLNLGTWGFGGPVALVGYMHRDLVENKKWIGEEDYREGLALSQLAPGPLAAQLAIYIGYVHYRIRGATLTGLAFVLPSFLMVLVIGYAYVRYGGLPWMQAVFYGVAASVIGIIAVGSYKLTLRSIGKDTLLWFIFIALAVTTFLIEEELAWVMLLAGILVWFVKAPPVWIRSTPAFAPMLLTLEPMIHEPRYWQIAWSSPKQALLFLEVAWPSFRSSMAG